MRRKKKPPTLSRILLPLVVFAVAIGVIALMTTLFSPKNPTGDTPSENTDTSAATENETSNPSSEAAKNQLKTLANATFSDETFTAEYLAVYDVTAGVMLYEKNAQAKITAASTTKLLTALTLLDCIQPTEVFTVGSELSLVGAGSSSADLVAGQVLTPEQILDALLIPSGNDAAYVIAAHAGRNLSTDSQISDRDAVDLFLKKMNEKAASLGVKNSLFTCPDGYPDGKQYTTAEDMMTISVAAAQNATIRKTVEKTYSEIVFPDGSVVGYVNTNLLMIPSSSYYYEGTFGMKTGSTPGAGACLIAGATAYGHDIVVALFKADGNDGRYNDAKNALNAGFEAVKQLQNQEQ